MSPELRREEPHDSPFAGQGLRLLARLIAKAHRAKAGLHPQGSSDKQPDNEVDPQSEDSV